MNPIATSVTKRAKETYVVSKKEHEELQFLRAIYASEEDHKKGELKSFESVKNFSNDLDSDD